jgi:DNA-binding MarR family transcriptional regulator
VLGKPLLRLEFKSNFIGVGYGRFQGEKQKHHLGDKREANTMTNNRSAAKPAVVADDRRESIRTLYMESLQLVERLHRRLLDVIKDEFDRNGRSDINAIQALLLFNIGNAELTAGELRSRGYYLGSNVSYNLKKLVDLGFINHQRSRVDRRSVRVSLTPKGSAVAEVVAGLYERHIGSIEHVGGINQDEFKQMNRALQRLDRFWNDTIAYRM